MSRETSSGYCHMTPGRLRVRVTGIKNRQDAARTLEILMLSQPGIASVRANAVTGNVLVKFNFEELSHRNILQKLADLGYYPLVDNPAEYTSLQLDNALAEMGISLGKNLAKIALKQALKGSAAAIILELL